MKKFILSLTAAIMLSSCATILGGKIDSCQKTKPAGGHRWTRQGYLIADILLTGPLTLVDFATGAIYVKCKDGQTKK